MKYINENFVNKEDIASAEGQDGVINVRFCRDCPMFKPDGVQLDPSITKGYCERMSYIVNKWEEGDYPYYVDVTSNSFCNGDEIKDNE